MFGKCNYGVFENYVRLYNLGDVTIFPSLLALTYHETRHVQQRHKISLKELNLESFLYYMDAILVLDQAFYVREHDSFFSELDANLYGIRKAKDYLQNNSLNTPKINKFLEKRSRKYEYQYNNYNFQFFFSKFCAYLRSLASQELFDDLRVSSFFLEMALSNLS